MRDVDLGASSSTEKFLQAYSVLIFLNLLFSLVYFKAAPLSIIILPHGSVYLIYIIFKSFKQKHAPFGFIIRGMLFLLLSAGLMIFFEHLSKIEAARSFSIFAYILTYIYSWDLVAKVVGLALFWRTPSGLLLCMVLFFSILAFYELVHRIAKANIDKKVSISAIVLLAVVGATGAWHNTFPREELVLPKLSAEEQIFKIDVKFPLFGFFELEVLRIHGIDKAAWYDRNEHGPILVRTTPDKIKRVNFGWAPIEPAPEWEPFAPREPNKSVLSTIPKMLYFIFLWSKAWMPILLFALFYYMEHPRMNFFSEIFPRQRFIYHDLGSIISNNSLHVFPSNS